MAGDAPFENLQEAAAWLRAEWPTVVDAAALRAAASADPALSWQAVQVLCQFSCVRSSISEWAVLNRATREVARRVGERVHDRWDAGHRR